MAHAKSFPGVPESTLNSSQDSEGERLERQIWADMKTFNLSSLERKISPDFQSLHVDGPRNRVGELEVIKNLKLGNYTLSSFKTTSQGDTIIVTYAVSADETIDDRRLPHKTSYRMSIWKNINHQWQWIAHANLSALGNR